MKDACLLLDFYCKFGLFFHYSKNRSELDANKKEYKIYFFIDDIFVYMKRFVLIHLDNSGEKVIEHLVLQEIRASS